MRINGIMNCSNIRANGVNQIKMSKPIYFGEEDWCGGMPDYQRMRNNQVENFFENASNFNRNIYYTIKHGKKYAKMAFDASNKMDSKDKDKNTLDLNGIVYDVDCENRGSKKFVTLTHGDSKYEFRFDKDAKTMPKEYRIRYQDKYSKSSLNVKPKETTYTRKINGKCTIKSITYNKQGYIYTEKTDENSKDYKRAIVRKFPNKSKSQYIEYVSSTLWEDSEYAYSYDPKTKNWFCAYK